ncbi:MAG: hypothetical protein OXF74_02150 [Rhodobacteraceae bacterium]|nr:hypothetical protein [Paracoccaceae bacterium]
MDPLGEAGTAFGLSSYFTFSLYLDKPLLPTARLEPIVRETNFAALVAFGLFRAGFERLKQVIGVNPGLTGISYVCEQLHLCSGPKERTDPSLTFCRAA